MDQGTSVFQVVVRRDGTLVGGARLLRSSGFPDLDAAAARAITAAVPFSPIPADLAPGRATLPVTFSIQFSNPMAR